MDFSFGSSFTGGYSPSQPLSQPAASASMTPSPKKPSTDKPEAHGVLPVTAKAYIEHMESCEKDTITMYGLPAYKVVLVGIVKSCEEKPTNINVLIDDQTGLVYAQNFQTNRKPLSVGDVVRVVAQPRPASNGDAIVAAINFSVIQDDEAADAIGFHLIQSCLAQCQASAKGVPMDDLTPEKGEAQTARPAAPVAQSPAKAGAEKSAELAGEALMEAIKVCIRGLPQSEECFAVSRIADALAKSAKPAAVKTTIDEMVEDGSLFYAQDGFVSLTE